MLIKHAVPEGEEHETEGHECYCHPMYGKDTDTETMIVFHLDKFSQKIGVALAPYVCFVLRRDHEQEEC